MQFSHNPTNVLVTAFTLYYALGPAFSGHRDMQGKHTIHQGLSLIVCENAMVFEETFATIDLSDIPHERVGTRALLLAASDTERVQELLAQKGLFPKVFGSLEAT